MNNSTVFNRADILDTNVCINLDKGELEINLQPSFESPVQFNVVVGYTACASIWLFY